MNNELIENKKIRSVFYFKLRVRHLEAVYIRNIMIDEKLRDFSKRLKLCLYDCWFGKCFYESFINYSDIPVWYSTLTDVAFQNASAMIVKIFLITNEDTQLIFSVAVCFNSLHIVTEDILLHNLLANTLILKMKKNFLIDLADVSKGFFCDLKLVIKEEKPICSIKSLKQLRFYQRDLKNLFDKKEKYITELQNFLQFLNSDNFIKLEGDLNVKRSCVHILREEVSFKRTRIKKICNEASQLTSHNNLEDSFLNKQEKKLRVRIRIACDHMLKLSSQEKILENQLRKLIERQNLLLSQLSILYPIVKTDDGFYSIGNVVLPTLNDQIGQDESSVSVGLSYVCHYLILISFILQAQLKYSILYMGDKSLIQDPLTLRLSYEKCNHFRAQFDYAYCLLNKNICQLRCDNGLTTEDLNNTLPNLAELFSIQLKFSKIDETSTETTSNFSDEDDTVKTDLQQIKIYDRENLTISRDTLFTAGHSYPKPVQSDSDVLKRTEALMLGSQTFKLAKTCLNEN